MRNACRFLDLPVELQQEIYDRCDVYSRLRLDHVLKNKFTHKAAINKTLILIAYALKRDITCVNTNAVFNTFLSQNRCDGSVRRLLDEYGIRLDELVGFELLYMGMKEQDIDIVRRMLSLISVETLNGEQLRKLHTLIYTTSVEMFGKIWESEEGRLLFQNTIFKNDFELQMFSFCVINYANLELAKHIFSVDAQHTYGINVPMMKDYILSRDCWKLFANRESCLKVWIESVDVPMDILQGCLIVATDTLAVDSFKFLKYRGVNMSVTEE